MLQLPVGSVHRPKKNMHKVTVDKSTLREVI